MTLNQLEIKDKEITYYVDSQSALKALEKHFTSLKTVKECKMELRKLHENSNKITLKWIPAHEGHAGNEQADELAKQGTTGTTEGPEPRVPISQCLIKEEIKNWMELEHDEAWKRRRDCRQTKQILPDAQHEWKKGILNYERRHLRVLTQLTTGHANLKRHRYIMGMETDAICDKCKEEEETAMHLMTECPHYWRERMQHLGAARIEEEDIRKLSTKQILNFAQATNRWKTIED